MNRVRSAPIGFTLVEIMIASVILAILLVGLGLFFGNMIEQSDRMDNETIALELCQQGLEEMRTLNIALEPAGEFSRDTVDGKFIRVIDLSIPEPTLPEAKLVECTVEWEGVDGTQSTALSTIY